MQTVFWEINSFPGNASDEILFLSRLSCFNDSISSDGKAFRKENIEKDFLSFLKQSSAYYQVRYIDELGEEIVRVDFDPSTSFDSTQDRSLGAGGYYKIVKPSELQDK